MPPKTDVATPQLPAVPSLFSVRVNGEDREIKMSYGLMDTLARIIQGPERIGAVHVDHDVRKAVLEAVLAKRKPSGKVEEEIDYDDLDIDLEDIEGLLDWVGQSVMGFFVRSLQRVMRTTEDHKSGLEAVVSFLNGMAGSPLKTP